MTRAASLRQRAFAMLVAACLAVTVGPLAAHDFRLGPLRIDHPYATPTPTGAVNGAAYLRSIRNTGDAPDRLIGASTPVARTVEIHRSVVDATQVMRMRAIDCIDLPPKVELQLRHGGEVHLMLIDLKRPLKKGEKLPLTLKLEKGGELKIELSVEELGARRPARLH